MKRYDCSGCALCYAICPVKAISMEEDQEGFVYPNVDEAKCNKCGKCYNSCSFEFVIERGNSLMPET
jgi:ferredoxin